MGKPRKPPEPNKSVPKLQLVPAPMRSSLAALGIDEAAADELREIIRSLNQRKKQDRNTSGDDELPPAA